MADKFPYSKWSISNLWEHFWVQDHRMPISGTTGKSLGGGQASPDYEPPSSIAKPVISCGLLLFLSKNVQKLVFVLCFLVAASF